MISHVVWDWNGTLLDDVAVSLAVANHLLDDFGLPRLRDLSHYRRTFRFPIVEYYRALGFDVSPGGNFEAGAHRYLELYGAALPRCSLAPGASKTLRRLHERGLKQTIISATRQSNLDAQVAPFGITAWLDGVHGLDDIYAASKADLARRWLAAEGLEPHQVLFVGDSEHDHEIADALGAACVLVSGGHHGRPRLEPLGVPIVDRLAEVEAYALGS